MVGRERVEESLTCIICTIIRQLNNLRAVSFYASVVGVVEIFKELGNEKDRVGSRWLENRTIRFNNKSSGRRKTLS